MVAPSLPLVIYLMHDYWLTLCALQCSELLEVKEERTRWRWTGLKKHL